MEAIGVTSILYLARHHKLFETYNICNHEENNDIMNMDEIILVKKMRGYL